MKKYSVKFPHHTYIEIGVEATGEDDAIKRAKALLGTEDNWENEDRQIHDNLIENGCPEVSEMEEE